MERIGDWIQTYSGTKFWPLDPRPEEVDILDIAHALSLICRFTGHVRTFYSVADHSLRVSKILPARLRLWGLLHDASEAYLSDLSRPVKRSVTIGVPYKAAEKALMSVIAVRFSLQWPEPPEVNNADEVLLMTERRDLLCNQVEPWQQKSEPLKERIRPLNPMDAEDRFLNEFWLQEVTGGKRNEEMAPHQKS